jgi:hypothetical protein
MSVSARAHARRCVARWLAVCLTVAAKAVLRAEQFAQRPSSRALRRVTCETHVDGARSTTSQSRVVRCLVERVRRPRFALVTWSAVLLAGCGFDTGGVGSGGASIGIGSQGEGAGESDEGPETGAETGPEGGGGEAPATTAATDDPTADPTTDPSGDPSGDPTTHEGSSGDMIDPTTGVIDPTTGIVDPTTEGGEGGGVPDPIYPTCSGANACADPTQDCLEFVDGSYNVVANLCVPACLSDSDCPAPDTGTAMPYCSDFAFFCRLSCDDGLTCPNGMACYALTDGTNRCAYTV